MIRVEADRLVTEEFRGPPGSGGAKGLSPIPYELRIAPDRRVWVSLLRGGMMVAFDPQRRRFQTFELPEPDAGPRRFDIDPNGVLWIPGYSASKLFRLDPGTGRTETFPLPGKNDLPYVARVHPRTGEVWIGTAAPDLVYRFDPKAKQFTAYRVATRGATMRHLAIDPRSGDVWVAYGASPAIHPPRVARLRVRPDAG